MSTTPRALTLAFDGDDDYDPSSGDAVAYTGGYERDGVVRFRWTIHVDGVAIRNLPSDDAAKDIPDSLIDDDVVWVEHSAWDKGPAPGAIESALAARGLRLVDGADLTDEELPIEIVRE